jgi:hypothetical protein
MRREEKEKREIKRLFLSSLSTFVSPIKKKLVFMWGLVSTKFRLSVVSSVFFAALFQRIGHLCHMSHVFQSTTEFFTYVRLQINTFFSFSKHTLLSLFFSFLHFFLSELFVLVSISPLKQHPFPVLSIHQRTR